MTLEKLLDEYRLTLDELRYVLDLAQSDCGDDIDVEDKAYCKEAKCFEEDIPACRKVMEIREAFYPNLKIKTFAEEIHTEYAKAIKGTDEKEISLSSIINWVSCKICSGYKNQHIKNRYFFDIVCNALEIKLDQKSVFNTPVKSIKQFKKKLQPITKENFEPKLDQGDGMTNAEKERLYEIVHVARSELIAYLQNRKNNDESAEFRLNIALYAVERNIIEETLPLIVSLETHEQYKDDAVFLQLYVKVLSSLKKDREAIVILERLITLQQPSIDTETHSLYAASLKRKAFAEYKANLIDDTSFRNELQKAKEAYEAIFTLTHAYYPAINSIYLLMILTYLDDAFTEKLQQAREEAKKMWSEVAWGKGEWWSCISNIEFLALMQEDDLILDKLQECISQHKESTSDYSIASSIRQLELYVEVTGNIKTNEIIAELQSVNKSMLSS